MKEQKLVSVIVPMHNVAPYIEKCITSVLNQSYKNLELILVDDGSTDGTTEICERYRAKDPRVKLIVQPNAGQATSRDHGLEHSKGDYICFSDGDDWYLEGAIEEMVQIKEERNSDVVVGNYYRYRETDRTYFFHMKEKEDYFIRDYTPEEWMQNVFEFPYDLKTCFVTTWGSLYDRKLFETVRYPTRIRHGDDDYTTFFLYLLSDKITFVNKYFYVWRKNPTSITSSFIGKECECVPLEPMEEQITLLHMLNMDSSAAEKYYLHRVRDYQNNRLKHGKYEDYLKCETILRILEKDRTGTFDTEKDSADVIQICFGIHDRTGTYISSIAAVMQSVMDKTHAKVRFHVLCDSSVSLDRRTKVVEWVEKQGHACDFHSVDECFENVEQKIDVRRFTKGALYRLAIPQILTELDKAIYLDADIFVNRDLFELWNMNLEGYALAAVPENGPSNPKNRTIKKTLEASLAGLEWYFLSGVMYMNLKAIREDGNLLERCLELLQGTMRDSVYPDQDVLNVLYSHKALKLDGSWNQCIDWKNANLELKDGTIYHFAGGGFFVVSEPSAVDEALLKAYKKVPFAAECIVGIYHVELKNHVNKVSELQDFAKALCVKRNYKKVYYNVMKSPLKNTIMKQFPVGEGDYFIEPDRTDEAAGIYSPEKLREEKAEDIVILYLPDGNYKETYAMFAELGLEHGKDYFNLMHLLRRRQGGYSRS